MNPDLSLADNTPELPETTYDLDSFNLDEWIAGVEPTIHSVKMYAKANLLGEIQELEARLRVTENEEDSSLGDQPRDELFHRLNDLYAQFVRSGLTVKVRGRSDEWRETTRKRLIKAGIKDENEQVLHMLADSIVEPEGFTVEHLRRLQDVSEAQVKALVVAWTMANTRPPTADFSLPSSDKTAGRARS